MSKKSRKCNSWLQNHLSELSYCSWVVGLMGGWLNGWVLGWVVGGLGAWVGGCMGPNPGQTCPPADHRCHHRTSRDCRSRTRPALGSNWYISIYTYFVCCWFVCLIDYPQNRSVSWDFCPPAEAELGQAGGWPLASPPNAAAVAIKVRTCPTNVIIKRSPALLQLLIFYFIGLTHPFSLHGPSLIIQRKLPLNNHNFHCPLF